MKIFSARNPAAPGSNTPSGISQMKYCGEKTLPPMMKTTVAAVMARRRWGAGGGTPSPPRPHQLRQRRDRAQARRPAGEGFEGAVGVGRHDVEAADAGQQ